jgi:hypothetical protein
MLELLRGLLTSREVLWPSEPHLSLYSTRTKLGSTLEAKLTPSAERSKGVFIGGLSRCFGQKWGSGGGGALVRSTTHLGWPGGHVLWPHRLSHLGSSSYRLNMTRVKSVISLAPNPGQSVGPTWGRLGLGFCHIISPCHIIWDYPLFWT